MHTDITHFLDSWSEDNNAVKPVFQALMDCLARMEGVSLSYKARPGVSHSVRARHAAQKNRDLFVLVDVIDDDPAARWLSVCFYADYTDDPKQLGDVVPGGLMGEDARCFDVEAPDVEVYVLDRLREAGARAAAE